MGSNKIRTSLYISKDDLRLVDEWRRHEADVPSRNEAILRMIRIAAAKKKIAGDRV